MAKPGRKNKNVRKVTVTLTRETLEMLQLVRDELGDQRSTLLDECVRVLSGLPCDRSIKQLQRLFKAAQQ